MGKMTIDELARAAGVTSRNVRAYQDRGLLPHPEIVGRTGYYDDAHLQRLEVISRLLRRGFSLAAIGDLLSSWEEGRRLEDVLGFESAMVAPYDEAEPVELTDEQLADLFGDVPSAVAAEATELGFVERIDDHRYLVRNLRILEVAATLLEAGYDLPVLVEEAKALRADADRIAKRWLDLWSRFQWAPFVAAGQPDEELPRITENLDRTRPVPALAASLFVAEAMTRELDRRIALMAERGGGVEQWPGPNDAALSSGD